MSTKHETHTRDQRARWISEVLSGPKAAGSDPGVGEQILESRLKAVEELLMGEIHEALGGEENNVFTALTDMADEFQDAINDFEKRIEALEGIAETVKKTQSQVAVLAQWMDRYSPFLKGMEDAFSTNTVEEEGGDEDVIK